jgi:hypothetical protein
MTGLTLMRRVALPWATAMPMVIVACRSAPPARKLTERPTGSFEYVANVPGTTIRGTLFVREDTIVIDIQNGRCRPNPGDPAKVSRTIVYDCSTASPAAAVRFSLDRDQPTRLSRVSATVQVARRRSVCGEWASTQSGGKYCVRYITETYFESETRRGSLRFTPLL